VDLIAPAPDGEATPETPRPGAASTTAAPDLSRPGPALDLIGKVEAEVAEVRRMAEPEPERTMDLVR
jgi:hypothetical protein